MLPFSNRNKVSKPKFLFNLQINELVNIPQSSGYCFVKWNFKQGAGISKKFSSKGKGQTYHIPIEHHRVQWKYSLTRPIIIKLQVDKNKNILPKLISFEVYLEHTTELSRSQTSNDSRTNNNNKFNINKTLVWRTSTYKKSFLNIPSLKSSKSFDFIRSFLKIDGIQNTNKNKNSLLLNSNVVPQMTTGTSFLGKIEINVAEYISKKEEPITNRFLLKDSKINSILNITFQLKLIRGSYDDFNISKVFTMGQLSSTFQNGLSKLLEGNTNSTKTSSFTFPRHSNSNSNVKSKISISQYTQPPNKLYSYSSKFDGLSTISSSLNPVVASLYENTFILPWDETPNEYSLRECIEDILKGGNGWVRNENGVNLVDLQALRMRNIKFEYFSSVDNNYVQKRTFSSTTTNKEVENYWGNMDIREYPERKNQHFLDQNSFMDNSVMKDNYNTNYDEYFLDIYDKNEPFD